LIKPFEPQFVISRVKELLRKPKPGTKEAEVEQYFDELDRAFANLSAASSLDVEPATESTLAQTADLAVAHDEPARASLKAEPPADVLVSSAPASSAAEAPQPAAVVADAAQPATVAVASEPAVFVPRPSLPDAFAALLAAERSANGSSLLAAS